MSRFSHVAGAHLKSRTITSIMSPESIVDVRNGARVKDAGAQEEQG